ncbi:MAG: hypothetical protein ABI648_01430 [Betaproteobacteria bacterium]
MLVAELGPAGEVFAVPVSVTLRYSPQYLASNGISDPTTLKIVSIGSGTANETLRTVARDTIQDTVTAQTSHFGRFGVAGYTLATLFGDYAFNFSMLDARFGPSVQIDLNVPGTPYSSLVNVPFPEYAFRVEQGTVTFDGAGNYSWTAIRNVAGTTTPVSGNGQYTVTADGTVALDFGVVGTVLAGGSTFVLASTAGVPVIEMGMGVKKGGTFNNASFNGSYAVALYYSDATVGPPGTINLNVTKTPYNNTFAVPFPGYALSSELRTMTFDGAGNYTWSGTRNTSGNSSPASGSGTYVLATDGTLTLDTGLAGNVLAGASAFILATPGGKVEMGVGLRKGGTFSNASLGGRYAVAYHYSDATAGPANTININIPNTPYINSLDVPFPLYAFNSEVRSIVFDGAGNYSWSGTRNKGGVSSATSGSGYYSVAADGALSLDSRLSGHVLEGGSTFILAPTSGQSVQIGMGVLR